MASTGFFAIPLYFYGRALLHYNAVYRDSCQRNSTHYGGSGTMTKSCALVRTRTGGLFKMQVSTPQWLPHHVREWEIAGLRHSLLTARLLEGSGRCMRFYSFPHAQVNLHKSERNVNKCAVSKRADVIRGKCASLSLQLNPDRSSCSVCGSVLVHAEPTCIIGCSSHSNTTECISPALYIIFWLGS